MCHIYIFHIGYVSSVSHLCFRQTETVGQLFPLGSYYVVIILERPLKPQELRRGEGGADALGFSGEWAVE